MTDRTVMGVDQSLTSTGICIGYKDSIDYYGSFGTKPDKDEEMNDYKRTMRIATHILELAVRFGVEKVYLEDLSYGSTGRATRQLAGLLYVCCANFISHDIEVEVVPPTTLKKFACGSGRSSKEEMIDALPEHVSKYLTDNVKKSSRDDMADAYWLMRYDEESVGEEVVDNEPKFW